MKHLKHLFRKFNFSSVFSRVNKTVENPEGEDPSRIADEVLKAVKGKEMADEIRHVDHETAQESSLTSKRLGKLKSSMWSEKIKKYENPALKPFINELWKSFLIVTKQGGRYYEIDNDKKKLNILGENMQLEAILKLLQTSDGYKINTNPWEILFTKQNGKTIKHNLEFFSKEHRSLFEGILEEDRIKRDANRVPEDEYEEDYDEEYEEDEYEEDDEEFEEPSEEEKQEELKKRREEAEEVINNCKHLTTPEAALRELKDIATALPEDLLEKISEPYSKLAELWANSEVNYESDYFGIKNLNGRERVMLIHEIDKIIADHYGVDIGKVRINNFGNNEQQADFMAINKTFGAEKNH